MRPRLAVPFAIGCVFALAPVITARAQQPPGPDSAARESAPAPSAARSAPEWNLGFELGVPKLSSGELRATGALDVGIDFRAFGGSIYAAGGYYDFESESALADWTRAEARGEGFWRSGDEQTSRTRVELRVSGGAAYYDTTYTGTTVAFTDETSTMGRGSLLAGVWTRPAPAHFVSALVGAGAQIEDRSELKVPGSASSSVAIDDSQKTTFQASARFEYRWLLMPETLSLRAHGDGIWFSIRRSDDAIRILSGTVTSTGTVSEYRQLEMHGRLALDVDALRFAEIAPGVFAGVDAYVLSGDAGSVRTVIPLAGVTLATAPW